MGMEQVRTISELESLTFEQRWLMQELLNRPGACSLRITDGEWVFMIDGVIQTAVPQEDMTELAYADLIGTAQDTRGNFVTWWPTISGRAALLQEPTGPEPFTHALPGLAAELITPDTSHLERIATALEDIAAGVLAIDAKLQRFISDADGKDPWQSDMAGHHE
jgi:hypothetical protein